MNKEVTKKNKDGILTFTMREFLRSPKRASALLRQGQKINVTSNGEDLFLAIPTAKKVGRLTGKDFSHIKIPCDDKNLSKRVDEIVYGK